ncbi:MAG: sulfotransferase family 2 domain-containing protein [Saonia sp.]
MLISHKKKFVFIHIYKTAGTSVMNVFLPYARLTDRMVFDFKFTSKIVSFIIRLMNWYDDGQKQFTGVHKHAPATDIRNLIGEKLYNEYFSFIFVRNPFDLIVSLYFYISQSRVHIDHESVLKMTFSEFVEWYISSKPALQLDFVTDPITKKVIVNYIGRFETLNDDMNFIVQRLGLPSERSLQHRNPSKKRKSKDYKSYYDAETRELVASYFQKDLDNFGYCFEGTYTPEIPVLSI